jgi:alpha-maltose-1-phosphate synthase
MKALLLTKEYPPHVYGGAGVHVEFLSHELARLIDVEVRCFGEQDETQGRLRVVGFGEAGRPFTAPPKLHPVFDAMARGVAFAGTKVDAQLVHCHTWYAHLGGIMIKQAYEIPLVVTVHSLEPLRPWKREQLGGGYDLTCWVERTALQTADAVVAVSQGTRADILQLFDVEPERVHVIHNGIDPVLYKRTEKTDALVRYGVDPKRPYVLFVGRITRQKGIIHFVRAIPQIDPEVQVVLCAGAPDTPEIDREMREAVAAVQAARPDVLWIREMVARPDVIQLYSHAAVFCCPSIYEPFGIINLEAMACGTPVVATAIGGIPEVVVPGETGLLVPLPGPVSDTFEPGDPASLSRSLADGINQLMRDPGLRARMGEAGRRRVEDHFSWSAIAHKTADLYGQLTGAHGAVARVPAAAL